MVRPPLKRWFIPCKCPREKEVLTEECGSDQQDLTIRHAAAGLV